MGGKRWRCTTTEMDWHLRETEVDGDGLGDVEESSVGAQGEGETVQTL